MKEFWSEKIIDGLCEKSGSGTIGEWDREAVRALKSAYELAVIERDSARKERDSYIVKIGQEVWDKCRFVESEEIKKFKTALQDIASKREYFEAKPHKALQAVDIAEEALK